MAWWILAFAFAVATDFVIAKWTHAVAFGHVVPACCFSALAELLRFGSLLPCLADWRIIIPVAFGHALGTLLAMHSRRKGPPPAPTTTLRLYEPSHAA